MQKRSALRLVKQEVKGGLKRTEDVLVKTLRGVVCVTVVVVVLGGTERQLHADESMPPE